MKPKNGTNAIDIKNWEYIQATYWYYRYDPDNVKAFTWETDEKLNTKKLDKLVMAVRTYRNNFGSDEIIYARLVRVFGNGPYVQMWWEQGNAKAMSTIIKVDDCWQRLEVGEKWIVKRLIRKEDKVVGIVINVYDENYPSIILKEVWIAP